VPRMIFSPDALPSVNVIGETTFHGVCPRADGRR
jgi:hypothetical protein